MYVEPELVPEPVRHARVPPPLQGDEVDVGEPPRRDADGGGGDRETGEAPLPWRQRQQAAEEVGEDGEQVVPKREELAARRRLSAEPALGEQPVQDDESGVDECQPVGPERHGQRARRPQPNGERDEEQRVLPRRDDVERAACHAPLREKRHRKVVQRQTDDERDERESRQPLGEPAAHAIATSVRPRLTIRTGPGKSSRKPAGPSRWFSFAQPFPARS